VLAASEVRREVWGDSPPDVAIASGCGVGKLTSNRRRSLKEVALQKEGTEKLFLNDFQQHQDGAVTVVMRRRKDGAVTLCQEEFLFVNLAKDDKDAGFAHVGARPVAFTPESAKGLSANFECWRAVGSGGRDFG
jgi:hypothetical protein